MLQRTKLKLTQKSLDVMTSLFSVDSVYKHTTVSVRDDSTNK